MVEHSGFEGENIRECSDIREFEFELSKQWFL